MSPDSDDGHDTSAGPHHRHHQHSIFAGMRYSIPTKAPAETAVSKANNLFSTAQEARPGSQGSCPVQSGPSKAQSEHAGTEFVPSKPIPIPGAKGAARLPVQFADGLLATTGSRAPIGRRDIELLEEIEVKDAAYQERYRRLKQKQMKWYAQQPAQGTGTAKARDERQDTLGAEEKAKEEVAKPTMPRKDVRVGNAILLGPDEARAADQQRKQQHYHFHVSPLFSLELSALNSLLIF